MSQSIEKKDVSLGFGFFNVQESVQNNIRLIQFSVTGKPPVQQRPRVNLWRNSRSKTVVKNSMRPFFYDPSREVKRQWSAGLSDALKAQNISIPLFGSNPYTDLPLTLEVQFYLPRPLSDYNKKKKKLFSKENAWHLWPATKDLDNMLKFLMDAMQGITYVNDNSVCSITCIKQFVDEKPHDANPYTVVTLKQHIK